MKRVLVVDDDVLVRDSLCRGLALFGYEVASAGDGREALELMRRNQPDALVCDLFMPEMDGLELLSKLRSWNPRPFVVAISGGSTHLDATPNRFLNMALRLGAHAVLCKPFSLTELTGLLRTAADSREDKTSQQQKGEQE